MAAQNPDKKPAAPRLTVKELKEILAQHIEGCHLRIDELKALGLERKIPGMAKEITRLHRMIEDIQSKIDAMKQLDNPYAEPRYRAELEKIMEVQLVQLNGAINEKFSEIDDRLDDHGRRLDGHNVRIGVVEADVSNVKNDAKRLTNRVYNLEHVSKAAVGWAIVAGIVVALLVGWILWLQPPMTREETLSDGVTTVPITYTVLHDFGSWFIGAAVGLIVAGLIILFAKQKAKYEVRSESTMVQPTPNTLHREASGTPAGYPGAPSRNVTPDTAPTKVVQTSGAGSGV